MNAKQLYDMGYTDLVSVIPPEAKLSPASKIRPESRGKSPGKRYSSGLWGGYDWINANITRADALQMDADRANVGLRAARYPAIDLDVRDIDLAAVMASMIESYLHTGPVRVGSWPKRLYVFRLAEGAAPFTRLQMFFDGFAEDRHLIEVLGAGQQYVVSGIHPKTGKPYEWRKPLVTPDQLPTLSLSQVSGLLDHLGKAVCDELGLAHDRAGNGLISTRREVNQDGLKATNTEMLQAALKCIPNTNETFPTREDYIRFGYALRGATQDDPGFGLQLYQEWAAKWEGNHNGPNDPERVAADWDRMHAPYELGVDFLIDLARQYGFDSARYEFTAEPAPPPRIGQEDQTPQARYSDVWLKDRFVERFGGRVRFVPQTGKWLAWDKMYWRPDDGRSQTEGLIERTVVDISNQLMREGATAKEIRENTVIAKSITSRRAIDAIHKGASLDRRLIVHATELDTDPYLLGTPAGVVDLRTGEMLEPDPKMLITRSTAVAPIRGACPKWSKFLREATGGDKDLECYLQRMAGYCLTGLTDEHTLFYCWGPGGNGKGVFLNTMEAALGTYAHAASMNTFTAVKSERHPTDLAALAGSRMVLAQEVRAGQEWDEQRIKALTGGDAITARFLFQDEFTYQPGFKLAFSGNHKPKIPNVDEAMRRRIHLIPFVQKPPKKNLKLKEELAAEELPAILAWAIDGAVAWSNEGLKPPACVISATQEYLSEEDAMGRWLNEACELGEGEASASDLYQCWAAWCDRNNEMPGTRKAFGVTLGDRNIHKRKNSDGNIVYTGISLTGEFAVPELEEK